MTTTPSAPDPRKVDFNKLTLNLSKVVEQSQRVLQEYLKRQERGGQPPFMDPAIIGKSFQELFQQLLKNTRQPGVSHLVELQSR